MPGISLADDTGLLEDSPRPAQTGQSGQENIPKGVRRTSGESTGSMLDTRSRSPAGVYSISAPLTKGMSKRLCPLSRSPLRMGRTESVRGDEVTAKSGCVLELFFPQVKPIFLNVLLAGGRWWGTGQRGKNGRA